MPAKSTLIQWKFWLTLRLLGTLKARGFVFYTTCLKKELMEPAVLNFENYIYTPYALAPFVVGFLTATLGSFVLARERGSFVSCLFFLLTWTGAVWLLSHVGAYSARHESVAFTWVKVQTMAVIFLPSFVYLFSLAVVQRLNEYKTAAWISCLISLLFCYEILTSTLFLSGLYLYPWGYFAHYGILSIPFLAFFALLLMASLRLYWVEYKRAVTDQQRHRAKAFMAAFGVSYLGSVDFLGAFGIPLYPIGYLAAFAFLVMAAQAIWQYRLVTITPAFAAEQIIATIASALLVVDREGTIRVANKAAENLFGDRLQTIVGKHLTKLGSNFFSNYKLDSLIKTGGPERFETIHHTSHGHLISLDVSATPIRDKSGQPVGAVCIASDITEWKRSQQLLQEAHTYAENIVNTVREPLVVVDGNLRVKTANRSFYQTFQFTAEETLNRYIHDLSPSPWNSSKMRVLLEMLPEHGSFDNIEIDYEFPSLGHRTLLLNACRLYAEGHHSQLILLAMEDITQRKEWEQKLIQQSQKIAISEEALRKQTHILETILSSIGDGVVVSDDKGKLLLFNPAAEKLFGVSARETIPANWTSRFGCYLPDKVTPYPERDLPLTRAIQGEVVNEAELYLKNEKNPAGSWLSVMACPLKDTLGVLKGGVVVIHDVTERKRAEEQLKKTHSELQKSLDKLKIAQLGLIQAEKMDSIGRLAAGVAHEVKNPLAIILQGVDYLNKSIGSSCTDETVPVVLGYTRDAVKRADSVIRGLLDFSTYRELELREENLNTLVQEALFLVKHEIDKCRVTVVKDLLEQMEPFLMDRNKIEQVFVNLFMNAIHAMPEGGTLTVRTYMKTLPASEEALNGNGHLPKQPETVAVAEVDDTGTGIPEKVLPKIFDPFFTTKPTGKGTGLGLTVTKNIIQLHGGTLSVRNKKGGGVQACLVFKMGREKNNA